MDGTKGVLTRSRQSSPGQLVDYGAGGSLQLNPSIRAINCVVRSEPAACLLYLTDFNPP
jgi:hypothetical protein